MNDVVCMFVNESTECETIPPAGGHVSDLHPRVVLHLPPAPLLQGRHLQNSHAGEILFSSKQEAESFSLVTNALLTMKSDYQH